MDPNACMRRLLTAIKEQNKDACDESLEALIAWLESGGFPPVFTSQMAGLTKWGEPKRLLRFPSCAIQTIDHLDDSKGWELVTYTYGGNRHKAWRLADA